MGYLTVFPFQALIDLKISHLWRNILRKEVKFRAL